MEHTKEPWHTKREGFSTVYIEARIGGGWIQEVAACGPTANGADEQEANARRIVACVNACAGISTENLEDNLPVKELARRYNDALKQRDKLLEELEAAAKYHASHECYAEAKRVEAFIASIKGESA